MVKQAVYSCDLAKHLAAPGAFKPFPAYADRAAWNALDEEVKAYFSGLARGLAFYEFAPLPATRYLDFYRDGNRSRYEKLYFDRRANLFALLIAECIAGDGALVDTIIDGVWAICEETSWVVPAHNNQRDANRTNFGLIHELPDMEAPTYIDLFAAETGSLMTWVYYFLCDEIAKRSPLVKRRIELEVKRRIIDPYLADDTFWWKGLMSDRPVNNWNPWINSNALAALLVLEKDVARRIEGVKRSAESVQKWLDIYHEDGGCDEGPGYFGVAGASLFDYLEELACATNGAVNVYGDKLIGEIAKYIYRVHISGDYFVNFADAAARVSTDAALLERVGVAIKDDELVAFSQHQIATGASEKPYVTQRRALYRALSSIFGYQSDSPKGRVIAPLDHYFAGIQVMTAHAKKDSEEGIFVAAKGGNNAESHNHNDVGSFVIYKDGKPVVIDAGVETYSKKTFSPDRYDIWTMQSCYHNLPTINGFDQVAGLQAAAKDVSCTSDGVLSCLCMDIANAYPEAAGILQYKHCVCFDRRDGTVTIKDNYDLEKALAPLTTHVLCFNRPVPAGDGVLDLGGLTLTFDTSAFTAGVETIAMADQKICRDWGKSEIYRVVLTAKKTETRGGFTLKIG